METTATVEEDVKQLLDNILEQSSSKCFEPDLSAVESLSSINKSSVGYVYSKDLLRLCNNLPKVKGRAILTHGLIAAYGLISKMKIICCQPATDDELRTFHAPEYIEHLKEVTKLMDEDADESRISNDFGIGYDCPPLKELYDTAKYIGGSSLTAAKAIVAKQCRVCINWCGGWHHGHRSEASGYCYVNDIILAILHLLSNGYNRVLYIDLDLHHGDAVEEGFAHTSKVFTVSFHKYETGFFPGSGGTSNSRRSYLNIPLKDGITDESFTAVFKSVLQLVLSVFTPDAIVCQCGADTLHGDPMESFNLTLNGVGECISFLMKCCTSSPIIFLGGGGYHINNTARLWTYITSIILNIPIDNCIPDHPFFLLYRPSYELHIEKGYRKDCNDKKYLEETLCSVRKQFL